MTSITLSRDELLYRVLCRVRPDFYTGCWEWTASRDRYGYGQIAVGRHTTGGNHRPERAHRVAYTLLVGEIPPGLHIDHLCGNKACCNPAHLEPVTNGENTRRAFARRGGRRSVR